MAVCVVMIHKSNKRNIVMCNTRNVITSDGYDSIVYILRFRDESEHFSRFSLLI